MNGEEKKEDIIIERAASLAEGSFSSWSCCVGVLVNEKGGKLISLPVTNVESWMTFQNTIGLSVGTTTELKQFLPLVRTWYRYHTNIDMFMLTKMKLISKK